MRLRTAGTVSAEGGCAAVLREPDSFENHAFDTIKGSDYLADQDVVEAFVREAPVEIIQIAVDSVPACYRIVKISFLDHHLRLDKVALRPLQLGPEVFGVAIAHADEPFSAPLLQIG